MTKLCETCIYGLIMDNIAISTLEDEKEVYLGTGKATMCNCPFPVKKEPDSDSDCEKCTGYKAKDESAHVLTPFHIELGFSKVEHGGVIEPPFSLCSKCKNSVKVNDDIAKRFFDDCGPEQEPYDIYMCNLQDFEDSKIISASISNKCDRFEPKDEKEAE